MIDRTGLTEKEFNKIAGQLKRRVRLNPALMGKVEKVANSEQRATFLAIKKYFGEPLPKCPAYNLWHKLKSKGVIK